MTIHPILKEIAALFKAQDREICLAGGAVRDMIRGKKIHDWDLATNAAPEEVVAIFREAKPQGSMLSFRPKSLAIKLTGFSLFSAKAAASDLNSFVRVHTPLRTFLSHLFSPLLLYFTLIFLSTRWGRPTGNRDCIAWYII